MKSLCNTRWESRIKSVKAIRFQTPQIRLALLQLYKSCDDAKSKSEESLASSLESFEFLLSLVIWYEILFAINMVSKKFQSKSMCIDTTTKELEGVMLFFEKYRNEGFESSMNIAKSLAFDMNIEPILLTKRCVFRKKQFDENNHDEEIQSAEGVMLFFEKYRNEGFESSMNIAKSLAFDINIEPILLTKRCVFRKKQFDENNHDEEIQSAEESFRVNYFLVVVDMTIASLKDRFEQLNIFENIFGFLFDSKQLKSLGDNELRESSTKFKTTFSHNNLSDVDANDLFFEMKVLQMTLPNVLMSPLEILELVKVADCYLNVSIAYRILLTMSVTIASAERSFSKLKLLKSYLRSSMSQERFNDLAILCMEKNMLENIDVDTIINDFASKNARRQCFL